MTADYVQPALDGLTIGTEARDAGVRRVLDAPAQDAWRTAAYVWLGHLPTGTRITSTDLIDALGMPPSPNAVGAIMRSAATQGLIHPTGEYIPSTRPTCHAAIVRVWTAA